MKKYLCVNYGYNSSPELRLKLIADTGFDGISVNYDKSDFFYGTMRAATQNGTVIDSLHLPFAGIANNLWRSEAECAAYIEEMKDGINFCNANRIGKAVVHLSSGFTPPSYSERGAEAFGRLARYSKDKSVALCAENLKRYDYLYKTIDLLGKDAFQICYDSGHANIYCKSNRFMFDKYGKMIRMCHLHDNNGLTDSHKLIFDGNTDWQSEMRILAELTSLDGLTLELKQRRYYINRYSEKDFLRESYNRLSVLCKLASDCNLTKCRDASAPGDKI